MYEIKVETVPAVDQGSLPVFAEFDRMIERVRAQAYELAEQRGFAEGRALDDWLAAEREICGSAIELTEDKADYVLNVPLPFEPGEISVNSGDTVTIELVATDVVHGLALDGYGISAASEPGRTALLTFVADRGGTFRLRCSVTMVWMMDTYVNTFGAAQKNVLRHVVTGKTISSGGSEGREEATGRGVVYTIAAWAQAKKVDLSKATFTVQGFGNVGSFAAKILCAEHGSTLLAAQDHTGTIHNAKGLDAEALSQWVRDHKGVAGFTGGEAMPAADFWRVKADVIIPAALEAQLTSLNAKDVQCRLVAGGANGPATPAGSLWRGRGARSASAAS